MLRENQNFGWSKSKRIQEMEKDSYAIQPFLLDFTMPACLLMKLMKSNLSPGYFPDLAHPSSLERHLVCIPLNLFSTVLTQFATDSSPKSLLIRSQGLRPSLADARTWLHQCIADHSECVQHIYEPPSRLLYIYSSEMEDYVRLVEPHTTIKHYAALSHCWGGFQPLRTTKENYEMHKKCIRFSELPQTFQDAVTIAKNLGIEYLWIDSLCIIQDSIEDWEHECSRMASVYRGALITIAASDAADSSKGFFHDYNRAKFDPCELPYWNDTEDEMLIVSVTYKPSNTANLDESQSRLSKRGWVLQERLLSQRVLSFRSNRLHWECARFCYTDNAHYPYIMNRIFHNIAEKRSIHSLGDLPTAFKYWCDIVATYSYCQLSKGTDKLPAISGLAQAFSKAIGDTYVAGLWRNDIHVGLTWCTIDYYEEDCVEGTPLPYRAPSWSWACSDRKFGFRSETRNQHKDLVIVSISMTLKGLDSFGELSYGILCVNGRMNKGIVVLENKGESEYIEPILHDYKDTNAAIANLCFDNAQLVKRMEQDSSQQEEVIGLLISYDNSAYTKWVGLVLEEIRVNDERRVFRRIGVILCHKEYKAGYGWFNDCKRESIEIV
jgi:hypothetical protein